MAKFLTLSQWWWKGPGSLSPLSHLGTNKKARLQVGRSGVRQKSEPFRKAHHLTGWRAQAPAQLQRRGMCSETEMWLEDFGGGQHGG